MYGIEKLEEVGTDLAKFGMKLGGALSDKKLSLVEAIDLGVFAVPKVLDHAADGEQIVQEIKDLDTTEMQVLVVHISSELELPSPAVEEFLETGLEWLAVTYKLYVKGKALREVA